VAFAAYPGGKIYLNNNAIGHDQTDAMFLKPGRYEIRVENRFLGNHEVNVEVAEGQTGTIAIEW
jgi:PEGA domain